VDLAKEVCYIKSHVRFTYQDNEIDKEKLYFMTTIIGVKYEYGIVIASDSQASIKKW